MYLKPYLKPFSLKLMCSVGSVSTDAFLVDRNSWISVLFLHYSALLSLLEEYRVPQTRSFSENLFKVADPKFSKSDRSLFFINTILIYGKKSINQKCRWPWWPWWPWWRWYFIEFLADVPNVKRLMVEAVRRCYQRWCIGYHQRSPSAPAHSAWSENARARRASPCGGTLGSPAPIPWKRPSAASIGDLSRYVHVKSQCFCLHGTFMTFMW